MQYAAWFMGAALLIYFAVELGWGGGNPVHKDHNAPPTTFW